MMRFLLICLGGAFGTGARYALSIGCRTLLGAAFPYGTLAVNVIGSFLLGMIMQLGIADELLSPTARLTLGTGVMGGFTTYSSFNYETLELVRDRAVLLAIVNVLATLSACFAAGWLGVVAARRLTHP
jgi:CrcB protein